VSLQELYQTLERVYKLGVSLPDAPLESFKKATAHLPRITEAERMTVQRVGQSLFRDALLEYWNGRCPLTGITDNALLRASHIVPWAECGTDELRLDVHNGLLLSALWDAAFDCGLISFADDGTVLRSPKLTSEAAAALNFDSAVPLDPLTHLHRQNLAHHRTKYGF
jgi:predicted restriction endonuclease